jgi:glutaredoxin-related protein
MNHTQLLNHLVDKYNLQSYLEIGVQDTRNNFDRVKSKVKIGVDPCLPMLTLSNSMGHESVLIGKRSDDFFSIGVGPFNLIFIDGLHHSCQVKRDFENSLRCLDDNGYIVIHDCLPEERVTTCVPRGNQKMWHGDVYKFCLNLKSYDGIDFITYDFDCGCCVVWKDTTKKGTETVDTSWENYKLNGKQLLNVSKWQG